jgi:hypothetical protein
MVGDAAYLESCRVRLDRETLCGTACRVSHRFRCVTPHPRQIVLIGLSLPFTPLARVLGFVPLPETYFLFLAGATLTYLGLVEAVKRRLLRRLLV